MTEQEARSAVWRAFPRRSSVHWTLTIQEHHTSTPACRVYRWWLDGKSSRQDPLERQGFVDKNGVQIE